MWLFWLYEFLGFVGVILLIFAYCHFSKKGFWSFLWHNLKWVAWSVVSYLPIDRTRALPGSKDHDSNDNGIPADNLIN